MPWSRALQVNLPACSVPSMLYASSEEAVNTKFEVIGSIRLRIEPVCTGISLS